MQGINAPQYPRPFTLPLSWRSEVLWLIALVAAAYAFRCGDLPLRGEEPTRAQIAREMVQSGDPMVPREQGELFLSRPPLQNWLIALSCRALGSWDAAAVRLPSVIATLLTTLLIYGYSRTFLSTTGAFAAAAAFATMGEMLQTGRLAETEAVFIFLVGASLLVWHCGMVRGWPDVYSWTAGYALMTLAAMAKGPQAPAYFLSSVSAYLLCTGQWRRLLSVAHLTGALVGVLILAAWMVPFYRELGWQGVHDVWLGDSAIRFRGWKVSEVAVHLVEYPLEIFGCGLPWSPFLLAYLNRRIWSSWREIRPQILFVSISLAIAFPTCWLPPGGVSRYFSPMYPCLMVLIGAAVERCGRADAPRLLRWYWCQFCTIAAAAMIVAGGVGLLAVGMKNTRPINLLAEPATIAAAYAVACIAFAAVAYRSRLPGDPARVGFGVFAVAAFLALTSVGMLTDLRIRRSENTAAAVEQLKETLPTDEPLYSFGHVDSLFAYYYAKPIVPLTWPKVRSGDIGSVRYFCFYNAGTGRPSLPFAWEEIAAVSVDRNHQVPPDTVVVVGRRIPADSPHAISPAKVAANR